MPGKPWIYWISPGISALFKQCRLLGELGTAINGCFTCDNRRFLRYWWEIGHKNLYPAGCYDRRNAKWFPYQKGGGFRRWYGKNDYVVNYGMNGKEIRARRAEGGQSKSLPGEEFYFHEGAGWFFR